MKKLWYESKTVWGGILFTFSTLLEQLGIEYPVLLPIAKALGIFLTVYGFRSAQK